MGNIVSSNVIAVSPVLVGFLYVSIKSLTRPHVPALPLSPRGPDSSFISLQSDEQGELESEIERAVLFIKSIKDLIDVTVDEDTRSSRKRQLEQTLTRAESSFNSLFELKTKLEQFETDGLTLGSRITSEIAKSVATRDIDSQLVFSIAKSNSMIAGDVSPFKRQRTTT